MINMPTSDFAGMSVAEIDTTKVLAHASEQARRRHYEDFLIVDVDCHHYENYSLREILEYMPDTVLRQLGLSRRSCAARSTARCCRPASASRTWAGASHVSR